MQTQSPIRLESLERRTLLAAAVGTVTTTPTTPTDNSLSALFGGSILFGKRDGGVNRLHAVMHVDSQTSSGDLTGSATIDRLGAFRFNGTATNGIVVLVFTGASGSAGTITLRRDGSGGGLRGDLAGTIGGVATAGAVRLHDNGGTPSTSAASSNPFGSTTTSTSISGNPRDLTGFAGAYSGTVQFRGAIDDGSGNTIVSRRVHAVLHVDVDQTNAGLFTGNLRLDGVGRFIFSGASTGNKLTLVFDNGSASGALTLTRNPSGAGASAANVQFGGIVGTSNDLKGKLFTTLAGIDLHALVRLHQSVTSGGGGVIAGAGMSDSDFSGGGNTTTSNPAIAGGIAAGAAGSTSNATTTGTTSGGVTSGDLTMTHTTPTDVGAGGIVNPFGDTTMIGSLFSDNPMAMMG